MKSEQETKFSIRIEENLARKTDEIISILEGLTISEKYSVLKNIYATFLNTCKNEGIILNKRVENERQS